MLETQCFVAFESYLLKLLIYFLNDKCINFIRLAYKFVLKGSNE